MPGFQQFRSRAQGRNGNGILGAYGTEERQRQNGNGMVEIRHKSPDANAMYSLDFFEIGSIGFSNCTRYKRGA